MEIIVIGGSYAGLNAALRAKRQVGGAGTVRVVTDSPVFLEKIRFHELGARPRPVSLDLRELLRGTGVDLEMARVDTIDLTQKRVIAKNRSLRFDRLVLAVGSGNDRSIPGSVRHAHMFDAASGASAMREALIALAQAGGGNVVVVGGGLTAIEASSEIAEAFPALHIGLLSSSPIGEGLSFGARSYLGRRLRDMRVSIFDRDRVVEVHDGRISRVFLVRNPDKLRHMTRALGLTSALPLSRAPIEKRQASAG